MTWFGFFPIFPLQLCPRPVLRRAQPPLLCTEGIMRPERHAKLSPAGRGEIRMRVAESPFPSSALWSGVRGLFYAVLFWVFSPWAASRCDDLALCCGPSHRTDSPLWQSQLFADWFSRYLATLCRVGSRKFYDIEYDTIVNGEQVRTGKGLAVAYSSSHIGISWEDKKITKSSVRIGGKQVQIRTEDLPNTILE
jgi:hypothetical protein